MSFGFPAKADCTSFCTLFLEKLVQETEKEHEDILEQADETDAMFGELYSWYLRNPEYRSRVQKLVQSAFAGKPEDIISQSVAKALYGEVSPCSLDHIFISGTAFEHRISIICHNIIQTPVRNLIPFLFCQLCPFHASFSHFRNSWNRENFSQKALR